MQSRNSRNLTTPSSLHAGHVQRCFLHMSSQLRSVILYVLVLGVPLSLLEWTAAIPTVRRQVPVEIAVRGHEAVLNRACKRLSATQATEALLVSCLRMRRSSGNRARRPTGGAYVSGFSFSQRSQRKLWSDSSGAPTPCVLASDVCDDKLRAEAATLEQTCPIDMCPCEEAKKNRLAERTHTHTYIYIYIYVYIYKERENEWNIRCWRGEYFATPTGKSFRSCKRVGETDSGYLCGLAG